MVSQQDGIENKWSQISAGLTFARALGQAEVQGPQLKRAVTHVSLTAWGPGARSRAGPGTGGPEGEAYGSYRILWHFKCKNHCLNLFNINMKMLSLIVSFFLLS